MRLPKEPVFFPLVAVLDSPVFGQVFYMRRAAGHDQSPALQVACQEPVYFPANEFNRLPLGGVLRVAPGKTPLGHDEIVFASFCHLDGNSNRDKEIPFTPRPINRAGKFTTNFFSGF